MQRKKKENKRKKVKTNRKGPNPQTEKPLPGYASLETSAFLHHPWEREGLCLDPVQHSHQQLSTPADSQGARPNPALTCRQRVELWVGLWVPLVVTRRAKGEAGPEEHRSAEARLGAERAALGSQCCEGPGFLQTCETFPGLLLSFPNL